MPLQLIWDVFITCAITGSGGTQIAARSTQLEADRRERNRCCETGAATDSNFDFSTNNGLSIILFDKGAAGKGSVYLGHKLGTRNLFC